MIFSDAPPAQVPTIVVVGTRADSADNPNSRESAPAARLKETNNVRNVEDNLRYFPSLMVRKRHIGDTQAPLATRTSGVGASARSLIYADGVLLSALIGNNNVFASPRWGMLAPEEIERVDVLYGPFSAAHPGNAIGAVVNFTTRMPEKFEATATAASNVQHFDQYATDRRYPAHQLGGTVGDRWGSLAWFVSANHSDSRTQPVAYVTVPRPATKSSAGQPVSGAIEDRSRTGQPIYVIGAGGLEHKLQDNVKFKLRADLGPSTQLTWQSGLFLNTVRSRAETYLEGVDGDVFAGAVNVDGRALTIAPSAFSNHVYRRDDRHWMHAVSARGGGGGFDWSLVGSLYEYAKDEQRAPGGALPAAEDGGAGSIVRLDGTGWRTLDASAGWHASPAHHVRAGAHYDLFTLRNRRFATDDWRNGSAGALVQLAKGQTSTAALWAEDRWTVSPSMTLTLGARYEWWRAFGGANMSVAPVLDVEQPEKRAQGLSPKASLRWRPADRWSVTLSGARALRFPTVSELYQAVATGPSITVPNPDLKPERARSTELAVERRSGRGHARLSLFTEQIRDALLSQTALLVPGSTTLFNYVQNVGRTRTRGIEAVFERRDILPRFDLGGSVTLADPRVVSDPAFPAAEGKRIPQVPARKATLVASWRPSESATFTLAGRYAGRSFGTIDNSDIVAHTYQGFEPYLVTDARASFRLQQKWRLAVGVENLTDHRYFLFHPFPGRTLTAEVGWAL